MAQLNRSTASSNARRTQWGGYYNARFAGEAFAHQSNPKDGPMARRLISNVAWKQPPSASVRSEVSV